MPQTTAQPPTPSLEQLVAAATALGISPLSGANLEQLVSAQNAAAVAAASQLHAQQLQLAALNVGTLFNATDATLSAQTAPFAVGSHFGAQTIFENAPPAFSPSSLLALYRLISPKQCL